MPGRDEKVRKRLAYLASEYLRVASNRTSLITVTDALITENLTQATVLVSVYPEDKECDALAFLKRHETSFRDYIGSHLPMRYVPNVTFEIDRGEKNRQHIDKLLQE